jgi:hypothetical protein
MRRHLILSGLIMAIAGPAWAQSATGGAAGTASGTGDYGLSGSYGGATGSVGVSGTGSTSGIGLGGISQGNGNLGISGGVDNSSAGTESYSTQSSGVPQVVPQLPSIDAGGAATGSASGLGVGSTSSQ